jgi:hypothetical protein
MRSRRSGSGRPLGDTKESDRRVTPKAPLGPTWKEGQASPRRRPQPFSRILTAWKGNSANFALLDLYTLIRKAGWMGIPWMLRSRKQRAHRG